MHITNIMTKLDDFNHQAKIELSCGNEFQAQRQLAKIRELLNSLPELEAGGGIRRCRVCGCTDIKACPDACHWIENDLCSKCA